MLEALVGRMEQGDDSDWWSDTGIDGVVVKPGLQRLGYEPTADQMRLAAQRYEERQSRSESTSAPDLPVFEESMF